LRVRGGADRSAPDDAGPEAGGAYDKTAYDSKAAGYNDEAASDHREAAGASGRDGKAF